MPTCNTCHCGNTNGCNANCGCARTCDCTCTCECSCDCNPCPPCPPPCPPCPPCPPVPAPMAQGCFRMAGARVLGAGEYLAMDAACGEYYNIGFTAGDPFLGVIEPGTYTACLRVSDICGYGDFSVSVNGAPLPQSTQPVACADACWEGTVTLAEGDQVAIMNGANMLSAGCASLCLTRVG